MKPELSRIGLGGGCHWCTEAYFQSLKGVVKVEQGWISSLAPDDAFSEAIVVHFDPEIIGAKVLIDVHLNTHSATKNHSFRQKYRSAVYFFHEEERPHYETCLHELQREFKEQLVTRVLPFAAFRLNAEDQLDYYLRNREGVFCERYISPKLELIRSRYAKYFKEL